MKKNEDYRNDFLKETCLHVAVPLVNATMSWMSIEDAGDEAKARELPMQGEFLGNNKLFMANPDKTKPDYVKLYIVSHSNNIVRCLYVRKDILYPGKRYHHVTEN